MTDHDALLAAIRDNPDEDTPRLVYADWLDENDQPARAEFIRKQIAGDDRPFFKQVSEAEQNGFLTSRRGFCEICRCTSAIWFGHYETILSLPYVCLREVYLTTAPTINNLDRALSLAVGKLGRIPKNGSAVSIFELAWPGLMFFLDTPATRAADAEANDLLDEALDNPSYD